jgi:hypothetical protein
MKVRTAAPIGTILGDAQQVFPTTQLILELVFKGGRDVMASDHGPEAHSGRRTPLGQVHYVAQIRLGLLGFDCLGAKSPLCIQTGGGWPVLIIVCLELA